MVALTIATEIRAPQATSSAQLSLWRKRSYLPLWSGTVKVSETGEACSSQVIRESASSASI